ncbi:MAG: CRISPR-associated endonuclease Cas1, partial [Candidatus Xenobia bacterium]
MYVTEQGAMLVKDGQRIVVRKDRTTLQWVHAFRLEQLVLFGRIHVSPGTVAFLLEQGIDTVFMSTGGRFRGRLVSTEGRNVSLRIVQFRRFSDNEFAVQFAQRFVHGKLANSRTLLRRHQRTTRDEAVEAALHRIRHAQSRLPQSQTLDEVRGWEGAGAAAYFNAFSVLLPGDAFTFKGRNRRPPRDPVNALLSFGYTLLLGTVMTAVQVVGLDPWLGTLHAADNGKPSLVLDLMEEFRPLLVDAAVLRSIHRRQ